ncbi:hypothetical protein SCLCIDRAFT_980066 [Scleroderma citrinum Foug A]|uniref:Uncharacterized protein n=1 Tax=Scleroderma citrinum Foug A TaxID=1036808 RepID=A0A0C3A5E7_9AGAM|nr:hypothetical protein SCLCIDRAFT_980066 [Scleroderma citrinum Foug A]
MSEMTSYLHFLLPVRKHILPAPLLALSERFSPLDNSCSDEINADLKIVLRGKLVL